MDSKYAEAPAGNQLQTFTVVPAYKGAYGISNVITLLEKWRRVLVANK